MSHLHSVRGQLQYSQHKEKHYSRNNTTYVHWCLLYNTLSSKVRFNSIMYTNTRGARNLHIKWLSAEYYWSTFKQWGACITLAFLTTTIHWPSLPSKLPDLNWLTSYTLNASLLSHILGLVFRTTCNIENCEVRWLVLRSQSTTSSAHGSWVQLPLTTDLSLSSITLITRATFLVWEKEHLEWSILSMHMGLILIKCDWWLFTYTAIM